MDVDLREIALNYFKQYNVVVGDNVLNSTVALLILAQ